MSQIEDIGDLMPSPSMVIELADLAPVKIAIIDTDGRFLYVNKTYTEWLGCSHADLVGKHYNAARITIDDEFETEESTMDRVRQLAASGDADEYKLKVRHPDGSRRTLLVCMRGHERQIGVYVFVRDITSEEDLESEVQRRGRALDQIFNLSGDVLALLGFDGVFQSISPSAERLTGVPIERVLQERTPFTKFVHPDDLSRVVAKFQEAITGVPVVSFEFRVCHNDGSVRWTSWSAQPVTEDRILLLIGRDITEEKLREEKFRQAQKMEAIGQLTGGIAHDFNNLLAAISGSMELMAKRLDQGRTDQLSKYITASQQATSRATQLTQRLLAFARRQPLAPVPVDVNDLVVSIEDLISRSLGPSIRIKTELGKNLWPTICDPNQLENSILNCAINARDAMPDGGELVITTRNVTDEDTRFMDAPAGEWVMISISDNGAGMPAHVRDRAFDPFFTTKPTGQGTGLGLSMLYGFVNQSEGHVKITSDVGQGTTIMILLPHHNGDPIAITHTESHVMPRLARNGETVLVVEDEELVRDLIVEVMQSCGFTVIQAEDASVALPVIKSPQRIDLLLSDVGLPGMNGRQLAEVARAHRPDLKVLFLTGYAPNATLRDKFLGDGMDMMTKPFEVDAVAARVAAMIGQPHEAA